MVSTLNACGFNKYSFGRILPNTFRKCQRTPQIIARCFSNEVKISPPASLLKEHIWAVHATNSLPEKGKLIKSEGLESALPTHRLPAVIKDSFDFTLGGLKPRGRRSLFAIVTPLSSILNQTSNISVPATTVRRSWNLQKSTTFLVPQTVDTSNLKGEFQIVPYDHETISLEFAVDQVIKAKKGFIFRMLKPSIRLGAKAFWHGRHINTPVFFDKLLKEYAGKLSFGDPCHSQVGDAYLVGFIEVLSSELSASKDDSEKYLFYNLLQHFYNKAKNKYFNHEEQGEMEKFLLEKSKEIPKRLYPAMSVAPYLSADLFHAMTWKELLDFQANYPDLFLQYHAHEFEATWAACRWLVIGHEPGLEEGLDKIIDRELHLFTKSPKTSPSTIFSIIFEAYNTPFSDRLNTIEAMLKIPGVQKYKNCFESQTRYHFPKLAKSFSLKEFNALSMS